MNLGGYIIVAYSAILHTQPLLLFITKHVLACHKVTTNVNTYSIIQQFFLNQLKQYLCRKIDLRQIFAIRHLLETDTWSKNFEIKISVSPPIENN